MHTNQFPLDQKIFVTHEDSTACIANWMILDSYVLQRIKNQKITKVVVNFTHEERFKLRKYLFQNMQLFDEFLNHDPYHLPDEDKKIVIQFKRGIHADFLVVDFSEDWAIFFHNHIFYKVYRLETPFTQIFDRNTLPALAETIIFPYKDHIVYDGVLLNNTFFLSDSLHHSIHQDYTNACKENTITLSF